MSAIDYDRYELLKNNDGTVKMMPFVTIPERSSDKYIFWKENNSRMDNLSQKYYNNPFYDFLILYANPQYVSEFDIPDNSLIRIPFPLKQAISDYKSTLQNIINQ